MATTQMYVPTNDIKINITTYVFLNNSNVCSNKAVCVFSHKP